MRSVVVQAVRDGDTQIKTGLWKDRHHQIQCVRPAVGQAVRDGDTQIKTGLSGLQNCDNTHVLFVTIAVFLCFQCGFSPAHSVGQKSSARRSWCFKTVIIFLCAVWSRSGVHVFWVFFFSPSHSMGLSTSARRSQCPRTVIILFCAVWLHCGVHVFWVFVFSPAHSMGLSTSARRSQCFKTVIILLCAVWLHSGVHMFWFGFSSSPQHGTRHQCQRTCLSPQHATSRCTNSTLRR